MKRAATTKPKKKAKAAPKAAPKAKPTLVDALNAAPRLVTPKAARARVAEWLAEIGRSADGKALKRLVGASPALEAVLAGVGEGSPFLWDLATAEPARLLAVLNSDPNRHLAALLSKTGKAVATAKGEAAAIRLLRQMKSE
jgi:[glutamine synthetase] adenylyltransferase / [glutamine synthetase]-adenylyl-L-tyrosine phosphorylase